MEYGCIPFDEMQYVLSLIKHNPTTSELYGCIGSENREHEVVARFIPENMSINDGRLYTPGKELKEYASDVDMLINDFNKEVYYKHKSRRFIDNFGDNYFIKGVLADNKKIIGVLQEKSTEGRQGYENAMHSWIEDKGDIGSEKRNILKKYMQLARWHLYTVLPELGRLILLICYRSLWIPKQNYTWQIHILQLRI